MDSFSEDLSLINSIPVVPTILDVICRTTGMGFAAVARVTESRWIACSVLDKIDFGLKPGGELQIETTICHEIRQSRQPVIIDEVSSDEVYATHHTPRQYGFQSYISMPILLPDGRFFGTLCAIDPRPARLKTPEVIGMFKLFAELLAFHIDGAERLAKSESNLVAERGVSDLREQFIGVLGHDLRTPLGAIAMGAQLLHEEGLNTDQAETVAMMERSIARMSDLINDALDFTRGRLGGGITVETRADVPLEPVLRQVIEEVRTTWPNRPLEARFDLRESVHFDRKRIAQLFTNLLSNAMTHGQPDRPVKITAISGGGTFTLSVANGAAPIPPAIQERLFEPFSRGGSGNYRQGLGLGLYIASQIAKSHGGTLGVVSTEEETRFTLTMPSGNTPEDAQNPPPPAPQKEETPPAVVVLGASPDPERYAFRAMQSLQKHGYRAVPVNPAYPEILGERCYASIAEVPGRIDTVTLYLGAARSTPLIAAILGAKPRRIIFNPGAENEVLAAQARGAGIEIVIGCTLVMLSTGQF